jgi:hypothetical protein
MGGEGFAHSSFRRGNNCQLIDYPRIRNSLFTTRDEFFSLDAGALMEN